MIELHVYRRHLPPGRMDELGTNPFLFLLPCQGGLSEVVAVARDMLFEEPGEWEQHVTNTGSKLTTVGGKIRSTRWSLARNGLMLVLSIQMRPIEIISRFTLWCNRDWLKWCWELMFLAIALSTTE